MSFLAPLFLLGALAVTLPVVFHLIRRTARERTEFSSLMLLRPTLPRLTRRSQLEHLWLLLLRCVVLCLLALGFARPFLKHLPPDLPAAGPAKRVLLLVDTSASMRQGNLWAEACDKAEAVLRRLSSADQATVFTFDRQFESLVSFAQWEATPVGERAGMIRRLLAARSPSWAATHLDSALIRAADLLADADPDQVPGPRQIVLISDLQEGSRLGGLQPYEWPKGIEVIQEPVALRTPGNAGLQWAADLGDADRPAVGGVRVRLYNGPQSRQEQFQLRWGPTQGGGPGSPAGEVYLPAGQSRILTVPAPPTNTPVTRLVLDGDTQDFDNTLFILPPDISRLQVVYVGSDASADSRQPLYYLQNAFHDTPRQAVRLSVHPARRPIGTNEVADAALLVVTDVGDDAQARALHALALSGKSILFTPPSAEAAARLAPLLGLDRVEVDEAKPDQFRLLGEVDFRHPLFAPFADARFSDFTKIHFWRHRRVDPAVIPDARVLARFDSGDAAMVEIPIGQGRVVLLTSGWHPADSQLALSTKFIPLLYSLLELSAGVTPSPRAYEVGDRLPVLARDAASEAPALVRRPDGSQVTLVAGTRYYEQTTVPGIYEVDASGVTTRFAVNLAAAESRTAPLAADELVLLGVPSPRPTSSPVPDRLRRVHLQNAELEGRQKLWRWFIVATLAVLLTETWLAGRTVRRQALHQGEATP
jgi:hypothetical protein